MHIGDASSHSCNAIKSLGFMNEAVKSLLRAITFAYISNVQSLLCKCAGSASTKEFLTTMNIEIVQKYTAAFATRLHFLLKA